MDTSGMLSQEEIDALLSGSNDLLTPAAADSEILNDMQKDAIGEIGNISMGSAATALSLLLNKKVDITTPQVSITSIQELRNDYPVPCVVIDVKYTQGLKGSNLLMIGLRESAIIADLMMGGSGDNPPEELNELHLSAVSEAMNQMMGSTATSLSSMFSKKIDISPPKAAKINLGLGDETIDSLEEDKPIVRVSFSMKVGDLIDSKIMQLIPIEFAQGMVENLFGTMGGGGEEPKAEVAAAQASPEVVDKAPQEIVQSVTPPPISASPTPISLDSAPQYQAPPQTIIQHTEPVHVQPVQFTSLKPAPPMVEPTSIGLLMDVPLQVTVELGRTKMAIKDILELGTGSIVELDKLAGEPVNLLVNGKLIAKGEVVVIDENFGLRITDIVSPAERMNKL